MRAASFLWNWKRKWNLTPPFFPTVAAAVAAAAAAVNTKRSNRILLLRPLSTTSIFRPTSTDLTSGDDDDDTAVIRLVDQCCSPRALTTLLSLHSRLLSRRRGRLLSCPSFQIKLMRALAACGDLPRARQVFDEAPDKSTIFFNVMIRGYVTHGLQRDALLLFAEMGHRYRVRPDNYTFPCALKAFSDSKDLTGGLQVHGAIKKVGMDSNLFVVNTLISMYSRCSRPEDAFLLFDEMPNRDVVTWNAMIAGYSCNGLFDKAIMLFKEMVASRKTRPDAGTMASILPALSNTDRTNVEFLRRMFDEMNDRNLVSWNVMIATYANNSMFKEAMDLYLTMENEGVKPDAVTLASILPACGDLSALGIGKRIHKFINMKKLLPNLVLENALMDMYANCGCLQPAREMFDSMKVKDVVSWTSIISAYGMHGHGEIAVTLFEQMRLSGIKPDSIAFVSVLSACSYAGMLNEGKYYFNCMTKQYSIVPRLEHYACIVDLLGRAGHIEEAYNFIKQMPIKPNERVWGALLGACRIHSDMDIASIAADNLLELAPEQSGYYVLLSNIYAKAGRWDDVTLVRNAMTSIGIKKSPGYSNVELENKVYTFHIGDTSHPQSKAIYAKLDEIMRRLKELGYIAETDTALHDVEEEDKVGHLLVHSEKLAIAFVLINTGPGVPIRIKLNLRMCRDCHHAAKIISSITSREIVLRDTNRFHHFKEGVCSCGDYW